jgi:hypothetical protein
MQRAVTLLETSAVQRQRLVLQSQPAGSTEACRDQIQNAINTSPLENDAEGTPESVVIRRCTQADFRQPLGAVTQQLFGASIAQAEELPQHQTREELCPRKVVPAERPGVVAE